MTIRTIVDAGPLVAFFCRTDTHHDWAVRQFEQAKLPYSTCEAVLSEVCFLLPACGVNPIHALDLVKRGAVRVEFSLATEIESVHRTMARYEDIGVSLADACLVRMSELHTRCQVMTVDRDFLIYRRDGRRTIPLLAPFT